MGTVRFVLVCAAFALACTPSTVGPRSSGSLGISADNKLIYVADADHDRVTVIDTQTRQVRGHVPVGIRPERVLVAQDGTVFVSNRGSRSISRLSPSGAQVEATLPVGAEPVGLALSPDGRRLMVANSLSGSLSVLDAQTLAPVEELSIGGQPWAVALLADDGQAYVTDFLAGRVRVVDLKRREVTREIDLTQRPGVECRFGGPARVPAQAADVVVSPDGERAYVAHVQSRTGQDGWQQSMALAVAPALSTLQTDRHALLADSDFGGRSDFPAPILATNLDDSCAAVGAGDRMDAPSSLVVDGSGRWIYVADHNSNAVAVLDARRVGDDRYRVPELGMYDVVRVGARPTGLAVSGDLKFAYVHNALDYTVSVLENRDGRLVEVDTISFADSPFSPEITRGRKLFYSAVDPRVTQPELGGVSCSSCHPDGRTDGLNWVFPGADAERFVTRLSARNTQALWGVVNTAPYHWDGMLEDLPAFSSLMVSRMGGRGLSLAEVQDLSAYLEIIPAPDNPNLERLAQAELAEGAALFAARCQSCHAGATLTDGKSHEVSLLDATTLPLNTPSLRGVFATPPYLHDGSAATLREVFSGLRPSLRAHDQRGLSFTQQRALEAYLQTL
jgi:YVTN family beta-propeller protein